MVQVSLPLFFLLFLAVCEDRLTLFLCHCVDLRNVCTEAGMFAIREDRDYIVQEDLNKAVRKLQEAST